MKASWLPDSGNAEFAEDRARLLALYWDDNESRESNQAAIDWWLQQACRDEATA